MAVFSLPGVQVAKMQAAAPPIVGVPTATAALLGQAGRGPARPRLVTSHAQYERRFGTRGPFLPDAVRGFFQNGGRRVFVGRLIGPGGLARCLAALESIAFDEVAVIAAPGLVSPQSIAAIIAHCQAHRRFAVVDCARADPALLDPRGAGASVDAAAYAPWLAVKRHPGARRRMVPPSGHVVGIYARKDASRGVWVSPANEIVQGALSLEHAIGEAVQPDLVERGVNPIRSFAGRGILVWGARTLSTDPEWKYVSVRRLFLFLERSIDKGLQWAVFEPNGEALWTSVRAQVETFLHALWRNGAFPADRAKEAFFVRCDRSTMTQADLDSGRLVVEIGFAPLRPAEFVVFRIGQWTCESCP